MPRRRRTPTLAALSTAASASLVRRAGDVLQDQSIRARFRANFTDKLPRRVRESLVSALNRKFGPHAIFPVFDILVVGGGGAGDAASSSAVQRLLFYEPGVVEERFWLDDVMALYRLMERYDYTRDVLELSFAAKFDRRTEHYYVPLFNVGFPQLVAKMSALTRFAMVGACDDNILAQLGRSCPNLTSVDVSESSQVTGAGLRGFVFVTPPHSSPNTPHTDARVNPCVTRATLVNIKDTDVDAEAVEALLTAATSLTSIGGFFYGDNVGTAICRIRDKDPGLRLKLEDLYDVCLTAQAAKTIDTVCPNLRSVSTKGNCLPFLKFFRQVSRLVLDFDFQDHSSSLDDFLWEKGTALTSLSTSGQPVALDLRMLVESCPNVEEILGRFAGELTSDDDLPRLRSARVATETAATAASLCRHATNLRTLVLKPATRSDFAEPEKMADEHLAPVLADGNANGMRSLELFMIQEPTKLTADCLREMAARCPNLRVLGQLRNFDLASEGLELKWKELQDEVASENWDLQLVPFCEDSLQFNFSKFRSS